MKKIANVLLSGLTVSLLFSCNNAGSEAKTAPAEPAAAVKIEDQGVHIDFTDSGKGDTVLLLIHGWCLNKSYWSDQVTYFKDRYRVVAVDLPGFGQSGKNRSDWSVETYGKDIDSVMDQLNLKNVILVGHSFAGNIIVEAALHAPDRVLGLVGIDNFKGFGQIESKEAKEEDASIMKALKNNFKGIVVEYFKQGLFYKTTDSAVQKRILNDVVQCDSAVAIPSIEAADQYQDVPKLTAVKKKIYLINTDVTPTDTAGFKANKIPYEIYYVHATGHFPMVEKPAEFNTQLAKVIGRIGTGAR